MSSKILLVDDHQLLLHGITAILKELEGVSVVAAVTSGREMMNALAAHRPDLVIVDLNMPGCDGLECLRLLRQHYPAVKKLVLTNYNQPELVNEVRTLGADGFLVKNSSSQQLKETVTGILSGATLFPSGDPSGPLPEDTPFFDDFQKKFQLTRREVRIIRLICQGLSTKEIAQQLNLSEFTISTHRKNISGKLKVGNVAALIKFARENGIA